MARINIEDDLFKDNRFTELCIKLQSRRSALGALVEAFVLAQCYVSPENLSGQIPLEVWTRQKIAPEIVESGLAREIEGFVEIAGAKEQFSWLVQRQTAGARGGQKKAENTGKEPAAPQPEPETPPQEPAKAPLSDRLAEASENYRGVPSSSSSSSSSSSNSKSISNLVPKGAEIEKPPPVPARQLKLAAAPPGDLPIPSPPKDLVSQELQHRTSELIGVYVLAWQNRYGKESRPDLRGKVQGQIKTLAKDYSADQASQLIQTYLQMDGANGWFAKKHHDFGTFLENINVVSVALGRGEERQVSSAPPIDYEKIFEEHT